MEGADYFAAGILTTVLLLTSFLVLFSLSLSLWPKDASELCENSSWTTSSSSLRSLNSSPSSSYSSFLRLFLRFFYIFFPDWPSSSSYLFLRPRISSFFILFRLAYTCLLRSSIKDLPRGLAGRTGVFGLTTGWGCSLCLISFSKWTWLVRGTIRNPLRFFYIWLSMSKTLTSKIRKAYFGISIDSPPTISVVALS